ncbi:MAG: hypothetical protein RL701_6935, partial [Pseudomonadota bacterium]
MLTQYTKHRWALCLVVGLTACAARASRSTLPVDPKFTSFIGIEPETEREREGVPQPRTAEAAMPRGGYVAGARHPNRYAIVIGIEDYREARDVPGAVKDARDFAQLALATLGVPNDHLKLLLNEHATKADIENAFAWVGMRTDARSDVVVFFAGHGSASADADNKLLPLLFTYEGSPSDPATAVTLYAMLTELGGQTRPAQVLAFVDACSETITQKARGGVVFTQQMPEIAIYSAASIGESSSPVQDGST